MTPRQFVLLIGWVTLILGIIILGPLFDLIGIFCLIAGYFVMKPPEIRYQAPPPPPQPSKKDVSGFL